MMYQEDIYIISHIVVFDVDHPRRKSESMVKSSHSTQLSMAKANTFHKKA